MSLRDTQLKMQNYLRYGQGDLASQLEKPRDMTVIERLDIYRNGYYLRLMGALKRDFPVFFHKISEDVFNNFVLAYLNQYPPKHFSIHHIADDFVAFVKEQVGDESPLVELVNLEWVLSEINYRVDEVPLRLDDLKHMALDDWGEIVLRLLSSVQLLQHSFNIVTITRLYESEQKLLEFEPMDYPSWVIVWRKDDEVYYQTLTDVEEIVFKRIEQEMCFADICNALQDYLGSEEQAVAAAVNVFQYWLLQDVFHHLH